ncbi:acyltransferase family protein [Desulfomarina sp.]
MKESVNGTGTTQKKVFALCGALVVTYLVFWGIHFTVLSSFARVVVDIESEYNSKVQLYYSFATGNRITFQEKDSTVLQELPAGKRSQLKFNTNNRSFRTLRIDPGQGPGMYRIYKVRLLSFFGPDIEIDFGKQQPELTASPQTGLNFDQGGFLRIKSNTDDPYIILRRELQVSNPVVLYIVPVLAGVFSFFLFCSLRFSDSLFYSDLCHKTPSTGKNLATLDGLRGLAALLVLMDHTGLPGFRGAGMVGVTLFFCLSGYLLCLPFAGEGSRIVSAEYMKKYFARRFCRILPMYYFVLTAGYFYSQRYDDYIRSLLFLQGNSILWTVLQEIHFYTLLPLIFMIHHFIFRGRLTGILVFLGGVGFAYNHNWLPIHTMYGMGHTMPLYLGVFLVGIMMGYFYQKWDRIKYRGIFALLGHPGVIFSMFLLAVSLPALRSFFAGHRVVETWVLEGIYPYLTGCLILGLSITERNRAQKFFAHSWLRAIGLVSYSVYLLHPVVLDLVKYIFLVYLNIQPNGVVKFLFTFILVFPASVMTYTYIERPFIRRVPVKRSSPQCRQL